MTSTSKRLSTALAGLLLAGLTGAIYAQVADFGFVAFDDDRCITANPVVSRGLSWEGAARVFTGSVCETYAPLTWLSHMLDIQLYGLDATGPHVTNAVLHVLNTLLLLIPLNTRCCPMRTSRRDAVSGSKVADRGPALRRRGSAAETRRPVWMNNNTRLHLMIVLIWTPPRPGRVLDGRCVWS